MVQSIPHKLPNYHVHKVHEIPKLKEVRRPVTLSDTEWTPLTVKVINHDNNVQDNYVHDDYVDDMIYDEEIFVAPTLVSKGTYLQWRKPSLAKF